MKGDLLIPLDPQSSTFDPRPTVPRPTTPRPTTNLNYPFDPEKLKIGKLYVLSI